MQAIGMFLVVEINLKALPLALAHGLVMHACAYDHEGGEAVLPIWAIISFSNIG